LFIPFFRTHIINRIERKINRKILRPFLRSIFSRKKNYRFNGTDGRPATRAAAKNNRRAPRPKGVSRRRRRRTP
jgi:hypothetical protein